MDVKEQARDDENRIIKDRVIDVWCAALPQEDDVWSCLYDLLNEEEKRRADRLDKPSVRRQFIAGRGFLKRILARELSVVPADIRLTRGKFGKPYLLKSNLEFNLSHCRDRFVLALARGRQVGVDIEYVSPQRNYTELAKRFFSGREIEQLNSLPPEMRATAFYQVWTRKEAFVKAMGRGIAFGLQRFSVTVLPDASPHIAEIDGNTDAGRHWSLFDLDVGFDYTATVCARGEDLRVRVQEVDWIQLLCEF